MQIYIWVGRFWPVFEFGGCWCKIILVLTYHYNSKVKKFIKLLITCAHAFLYLLIYYKKCKNQLHLRAKSLLQKLFQMIQVTVPIFFYFDVISKIGPLEPKNTYFWPFSKKDGLYFWEYVKIRKKKLEQ